MELGTTVRDIATGFTGILFARTEYLRGKAQFMVRSPALVDGRIVDEWFDIEELEEVTS